VSRLGKKRTDGGAVRRKNKNGGSIKRRKPTAKIGKREKGSHKTGKAAPKESPKGNLVVKMAKGLSNRTSRKRREGGGVKEVNGIGKKPKKGRKKTGEVC